MGETIVEGFFEMPAIEAIGKHDLYIICRVTIIMSYRYAIPTLLLWYNGIYYNGHCISRSPLYNTQVMSPKWMYCVHHNLYLKKATSL